MHSRAIRRCLVLIKRHFTRSSENAIYCITRADISTRSRQGGDLAIVSKLSSQSADVLIFGIIIYGLSYIKPWQVLLGILGGGESGSFAANPFSEFHESEPRN